MDRSGLVARIAETGNCTKKLADEIVENVINAVSYALNTDGKLQITGFGRFKVTERAARTGVNPKTGEKIDIPASKVISFKAGEKLKASIVAKKAAPAKKVVAKKVIKKAKK